MRPEVEEKWVPITGYEGLYEISNKGNVRSLRFRNGQADLPRIRYMSPTDNGNGYLIVSLHDNTKRQNRYIHDLVAEAFHGKRPPGYVVNHIDHNQRNNQAENLEWCTQKENVMHSADRMKHPKSFCKLSNTGEKYISKRANRYRVCAPQKWTERSFSTFNEALAYKCTLLMGGTNEEM